jgi:carboxyl-terminal processing protease
MSAFNPKNCKKQPRIGLLVVLLLLTLPQLSSLAAFQDSPRALVDEAWQVVQRGYVDRTFNKQDWMAVRTRYLSGNYADKTAAYGAIAEMLESLGDPYTRFLTPAALKELADNVSGDFVGVGLTVSLDPKTREWIVEKTFDESPAAIAGLKQQDTIVSLNGTPTPTIDPTKAAPYLIGPVGSKLAVQVRRGSQKLSFNLVRESINLNPLTYQSVTAPIGKVGYIRLPIFSTKSPNSMRNALQNLESQKVVGYLLDLRGNPGGVLDAGIAIARQWLQQGTIVSFKERDLPQTEIRANQQALTNKPLVVLVDQQSASASEVLAAALQENRRAVIVGTVTFGKGRVQSFEPLRDSSGVLVTIAKYLTPSGKDIDHLGVKPNIAISAMPEQSPPTIGDPQYQIALSTLSQLLRRVGPQPNLQK